jgi:hypothetical protein
MERLIAYAEKKGPEVQVRFRRIVPKSMERADTAVSKNRAFQGVVSLPSRYVDVAHAHVREAEASRAIIARLQQAFPPEIVSFVPGAPIDDPEALLPIVTVPTLFIEHGADWTGAISSSANPRGVFVGLGMVFSATFTIPDDPKPLHFKTTIYRSPDLAAAKGIEKPEEQIYTQMDTEAFGLFVKKLLGIFFK